jgi:hypothetical protein
MPGQVRVALANATLTVDGEEIGRDMVVTVRDGTARAEKDRVEVLSMPVADVVRRARRAYTITGTDGQVWSVSRKCGCKGG